MLRARVAAAVSVLAGSPARTTPGTILHNPPRPCRDLSQNLSYRRDHIAGAGAHPAQRHGRAVP